MPYLRGLTVHIIDSEGNDLQEWGTQNLHRQQRISTYIQSTTGLSFQVSVQPRIPFIDRGHPLSDPESGSRGHQATRKVGRNAGKPLSSPIRTPNIQTPNPPYSFLASLYLDGRRTPERRVVVYLDPDNEDFTGPDGKVLFKHRWVQTSDDTMTEHAWIFKERAIESVFNRLAIVGVAPHDVGHNEDTICNAMQSSGFDTERLDAGMSKVGQILIEIERIILGTKKLDNRYRARHRAGMDEEVDMDGQDITHTTGFIAKKPIHYEPVRVVDYWPYKQGEGSYATFQFFYRSHEQLRRFGFPGFEPNHNRKTRCYNSRELNATMADKTPLSISQRSTKMSKRKDEDEDSYEHKVEKRIFKDKALKADFGMAYRDSFKALPYLEHVAPDTSSLGKGTRMPGLVKVAPPETEVDPAATTATIKATPDSTPVDSTHMEYRSMRNYFADIEKAFNSRQLDTIPEIPYREPLSKENIAKLNIKHKDGYRMLDSTHDQASDAEDEAEDDKTTKWDTETHVGDRDFNTINPWQTNAPNDMEYKAFEVLRSQFKKVGIKKRTRADVEQAQAQAEAEDETDAGQCNSPGPKIDQETSGQATLTLSLTEEELTQRSKKVKLATSAAEVKTPGDYIFWAQMGIQGEAYRVDADGNQEVNHHFGDGREH